jgi:hypothetical protein
MEKRYFLIFSIILLCVTACGGDVPEDTSELIIPTAVIQEGTITGPTGEVATAILQPTAVLFLDTPTPAATAVLTETTVPTPTSLPPTLIPQDETVIENTRPFLSQDLLFIGGGELRRWSRRDGSISTLLFAQISGRQELLYGNVHRFSVNETGTVAVAARAIPTESMNSELWWVDTTSGENRQLVANVPGLIDLALSPDGRSLLYVASDADNLFQSGTVYRLDLNSNALPIVMGTCTDEPTAAAIDFVGGACLGVKWSRDSQNMLWSDAQGIWLRHVNASEPRLILPVTVVAGAGVLPNYYLRDWSLDGRYLLLHTIQFEGIGTAVLDLVTNQLIPMPETTVGPSGGYRDVDWMQDGRLFVFRSGDEQGRGDPLLQLWRLTDGQLNLEETTILQLPPHNWLQNGIHFITGRFAFTLLADDPEVRGLYLMASSNEQPQKVNSLPYITGETTWLYDNVGTIFAAPGRDDAFMFLRVEPDGEEVFYDIRPFLGDHASDFYWLPQ